MNNGSTQRLSGITAALFLLSFILFLSGWAEIDVREDPHYHIADNKLG